MATYAERQEAYEAIERRLPDPDDVGQSEYRALNELLLDAAHPRNAIEPDELHDVLIAMLNEVSGSVAQLRKSLGGEDAQCCAFPVVACLNCGEKLTS